MEHETHEPSTSVSVRGTGGAGDRPSPFNLPAASTRHDGWTGEKMATFCETLAETAVVAEACDQAGMGISGAYALRRRNPFFAATWDAALTIARERLADTLLARSIEGNVEQIYRDGELVGERHVLDNRLGLAILRRLDRLAETGTTVSSRGERSPVRAERSRSAPSPTAQSFDWDMMVNALRTGDPEDVAQALALLKGHEVEEVEGPPGHSLGASGGGSSPVSLIGEPEDDTIDLSGRCWLQDEMGEILWMTDFPPPPGFDGYEKGEFTDFGYERECTPEEAELIEASAALEEAEERAAEEQLRDSWFAMLRRELAQTRHPGSTPG